MTLHELSLYVQGRGDAQDHEMELAAWMVTHLVNVHLSKRKMKMDDLLGAEHKKRRRDKAPGSGGTVTVTSMDDIRIHARSADLRKREAAWRESEEGRRVQAILDGAEPEE